MPLGLPITSEKISTKILSFFNIFSEFKIILFLAKLLSVTNNGFLIFKFLQAKDKSLIRFSPTQRFVG